MMDLLKTLRLPHKIRLAKMMWLEEIASKIRLPHIMELTYTKTLPHKMRPYHQQ